MGDGMEMLGDRMEVLEELEGPQEGALSCLQLVQQSDSERHPCAIDRCLRGTPNRQQKLPWGQSLKFL